MVAETQEYGTKTPYGTVGVPYTEEKWKIPGYTGHLDGLQETFSATPIMSQLETYHPLPESFLHTRRHAPPVAQPQRDPCNQKHLLEATKTPQNMWPNQQTRAQQQPCAKATSNIALGDLRTQPFERLYDLQFKAPFEVSKRIRSPMRNPDLAKAGNLLPHYMSAYNRVGAGRLKNMVSNMAERLAAKLGNSNINAFKMRKLFKMYDKEKTGLIQLEDLRMMMETFGIQLDDDSLLSLYYAYDPYGTGQLEYERLMSALLDPDYLALYSDNQDNTQARVDRLMHLKTMQNIKEKFQTNIEHMGLVFKSMDSANSEFLEEKDFLSGCAALGVVMTDMEWQYIKSLLKRDAQNRVAYKEFCTLFQSKQ